MTRFNDHGRTNENCKVKLNSILENFYQNVVVKSFQINSMADILSILFALVPINFSLIFSLFSFIVFACILSFSGFFNSSF